MATDKEALRQCRAHNKYLAKKNREFRQVIEAFIVETCDYMTINRLGDCEKQHNIKWARKVLG